MDERLFIAWEESWDKWYASHKWRPPVEYPLDVACRMTKNDKVRR